MNEKQKINKSLLIGWGVLIAVLLLAYTLELAKGERTLFYFIVFFAIGVVPFIVAQIIYRADKESDKVMYFVAYGYAAFYLFVLLIAFHE